MSHQKQQGVFGILLLLIFAAAPITANAGDTPSASELLEAASFDLKRPLKADSIDITATRKQGAEASLVVRQKFVMKVSFTKDTYKKSGNLGDKDVLSVVTRKGTTTTLYGLAESSRSSNAWQTKLQFDNNIDYTKWGSPRSAFQGNYVISGSAEEQELLARLQREKDSIEQRQKAAADLANAMEAERKALKDQKEKQKALDWEKDFSELTERLDRGSHDQRVSEIKKAFQTADTKLHQRLMAFLSKHDDIDLRSIAIRMKIEKAGKIEGLANNGNPKIEAKYPLSINNFTLNADSGEIKLDFTQLAKGLSGTINAESINAKNNTCTLSSKLIEPNKLGGNLKCSPRWNSRKVILFLPE